MLYCKVWDPSFARKSAVLLSIISEYDVIHWRAKCLTASCSWEMSLRHSHMSVSFDYRISCTAALESVSCLNDSCTDLVGSERYIYEGTSYCHWVYFTVEISQNLHRLNIIWPQPASCVTLKKEWIKQLPILPCCF